MLEEFRDNLEDTEVRAHAHISHDSGSERPTKVALWKHSVHTHFSKDRNCEVCLRTKMTRAPCRRCTGEAAPLAEKFGDLITADHKVLSEDWISKQSPIRSRGTSREKLKLLRRRKRVWESFSSRRKNRKSLTLTIHWNLANLVKIYHGIIELQHLIDPRRMALLKEPHAEWKKEHLLYCCNQAWMKNGGLILWNAVAICDMSKTSWQMWKLLMKGDAEKHCKVQ